MSNHILFIYEGVKTEPNITSSIERDLINHNKTGQTLIHASYGHNIYQLFSDLNSDPDLDVFELVKETIANREKHTENDHAILAIEDRDDISDIYLFFDYDGHTSNARDHKLTEMLQRFNHSQENGALFVSYPMVEAIRHIEDEQAPFHVHPIANLKDYKKHLTDLNKASQLIPLFYNWGLYNIQIWRQLTTINLHRANQLVFQQDALPDDIIAQQTIFEQQKAQHIEPYKQISVLSAFPLMLYEYYGSTQALLAAFEQPTD